MGKWEDLENEEAEHEGGRLIRDTMEMGVFTAVAVALTGPIGAAAVATGIAAKKIADVNKRARERDDG